MIIFEDECVDCPKEMGCIGNSCIYKNVPHFYCDECKDETDIYDYEGRQLCISCIENRLRKIGVNDAY